MKSPLSNVGMFILTNVFVFSKVWKYNANTNLRNVVFHWNILSCRGLYILIHLFFLQDMLWLSKWEELDVRIICDNELRKKIFTSTWSDDAH